MKNRFRDWTGKAVLLAASSALTFAGAETALRIRPELGGRAFANGIRSRYRTGPEGIYYRDPRFPETKLMKPHHSERLTYNGYSWSHQTDTRGFRNGVQRDRADVILLGDSYIYGHGVEAAETVGAYLQAGSGLSVLNMARQGDGPWDQLCLLNAYIGTFRPRHVVHFFFQNDIADLARNPGPEVLARYLASPDSDAPCPEPPKPPSPALTEPAADSPSGLYLLRLWRGRPSLRRWAYVFMVERHGYRLPSSAHEGSLEWRAARKALLQMRAISVRNGARFWVAPILPSKEPSHVEHGRILKTLARLDGLSLVDTSVLESGDPRFYLPGDGHFSPFGAERLADLVAKALLGDDGR